MSTNFQNLKYNLYEIIGVTRDDSEKKIKKNYLKLAKELHPDKNPDFNEEVWNHISIANTVLNNPQTREKYNEFLDQKNKKESFQLKNSFEYEVKDIEKMFPVKEDSKQNFKSKIEELNKKHGFNATNDTNVLKQYNTVKQSRGQISIPQERISGTSDFNSKFENRKDNGTFNDQLITINQGNSSLAAYQVNDGLASINDYSSLYLEDSISTGGFTSLDLAFKLHKVDTNIKPKTLEEKMKEYKSVSTNLSSRKPVDYSSTKFEDWHDSNN
jgi:curved DNA-binding protein CbpA